MFTFTAFGLFQGQGTSHTQSEKKRGRNGDQEMTAKSMDKMLGGDPKWGLVFDRAEAVQDKSLGAKKKSRMAPESAENDD